MREALLYRAGQLPIDMQDDVDGSAPYRAAAMLQLAMASVRLADVDSRLADVDAAVRAAAARDAVALHHAMVAQVAAGGLWTLPTAALPKD